MIPPGTSPPERCRQMNATSKSEYTRQVLGQAIRQIYQNKKNRPCFVLVCVFTYIVPCCDVRYDFHIKTIFGSSLLPVICRMDHVLFTLFVLALRIVAQHILCCVFVLFLFVLSVASYARFSIFDCPFGIL